MSPSTFRRLFVKMYDLLPGGVLPKNIPHESKLPDEELAHYAYHIGQIVYLGKIAKGEQWESLSIPKGGSKQFNEKKFSQEKSRKHFTDEA